MTDGASLRGIEQVLSNLERHIGEESVRRGVNKALSATAKEIEPDFKEVISTFKDTGATVDAIVISGISRISGAAQVTLGFGKGDPTRWQLVHLNELGYAKNPHPTGFGVIRRFSDSLERAYPEKLHPHLKDSFKGGF